MTLRSCGLAGLVGVVAWGLTGCTASGPAPTESARVSGAPVATVAPSVGVATDIAVAALDEDREAGGRLIGVPAGEGLPELGSGRFYWLDPFGNVWATASDAGGETRVLETATGEIRDLGTRLMRGRATDDGANGMVGERVLAPDGTVVWQARDEGGDLTYDSYDVFAWGPGGEPVLIGGTEPDIGDLAFSAPGDGNYLTVAGGHAWWVDGRVREDSSTATGYQQYSAIYSAPLDGASVQRVAVDAARLPQVDSCAASGISRLAYAVDATSTGQVGRAPEIHIAELGTTGAITSDTVVWKGSPATGSVESLSVCGDLIAAAWTVEDELGTVSAFVTILDGSGSTTVIALDDLSNGAGRLTAVEGGVFFFEWGPGTQVFWSRVDGTAYIIGTGGSFGFGAAADGTVVMPDGSDPVDGIPTYTLRRVSVAQR